MILRLLTVSILLSGIAGCAGTREAYKVADSPDKQAFVIAEHYAALVHEAANLKEAGVPADVVKKMQAMDDIARPLVFQLRPLTDAYLAVDSAENKAALEKALGQAALAVSNLTDAVRGTHR